MGKRGENAFKRNDAVRALESARAGGLEPVMMEVILGPDGTTTFRVYGDNAVKETTHDTAAAKEWNQAIADLKATGKGQ